MKSYLVSFDNIVTSMSEEELLNFVKTAVINNKDIANFSVKRIGSLEIEENNHVRILFA